MESAAARAFGNASSVLPFGHGRKSASQVGTAAVAIAGCGRTETSLMRKTMVKEPDSGGHSSPSLLSALPSGSTSADDSTMGSSRPWTNEKQVIATRARAGGLPRSIWGGADRSTSP